MALKKQFAIIYGVEKKSKRTPFITAELNDAYVAFLDRAEEFGLSGVVVDRSWYSKGSFSQGWIRKKGEWKNVKTKIQPSLIMDKSSLQYNSLDMIMELANKCIVLNPWEMNIIATDKLMTSATFSDIVAPTYLVRNEAMLKDITKHISTKEIVIKPRLGSGGKGIQIIEKKKIATAKIDSLSIVQPYIDTSAGIPGLYKGIHDFRVVFVGDKPVVSYIRTPAPGTRLCNISQGGSVIMVPLSKMPKKLKPLIASALQTLEIFPYKAFSLDFFFDQGKTPYLIEVNTKPIMAFPPQFQKTQERMHEAYLKYFASLI